MKTNQDPEDLFDSPMTIPTLYSKIIQAPYVHFTEAAEEMMKSISPEALQSMAKSAGRDRTWTINWFLDFATILRMTVVAGLVNVYIAIEAMAQSK